MSESILIIEDDERDLESYKNLLIGEFECVSIGNVADANEYLRHNEPTLVILGLTITDVARVQLVDRLLKECPYEDLNILCISGENHLETKLKAYEAGVADLLVKPFEAQELLLKVRQSVFRRLKNNELMRELRDSQIVVYNAMEQASQYSTVMNFFKHLSKCKSVQEVADVFFNTMQQFKLNCSLKVCLPELAYFRSDQNEVSSVEKDVFEVLADRGRIFPFSSRMIINDKHVSFIIKNPPTDEFELGQVRDYVAAMIEVLEAKVIELYSQKGMNLAIADLGGNIHQLRSGIKDHNEIINSVMSNMVMEIAGSFHDLEMTEKQESFLSNLIEKSSEQLSCAEVKLLQIMTGMESIKENMQMVQAAVEGSAEATRMTVDVELF